MTPRRPLDDVELLIVDGNNLLHRTSGGVEHGALRSLLAQLRGVLEPPTQAILMLDGHPAPGSPARQRVSGSLEVRHSGSTSADDAIVQVLTARPYAARARTLVVSDDRSLVERSRSAGGRTQRLEWLQKLLARPPRSTGAAIGRRQPPPPPSASREADEDRTAWRPGRGATKKVGNPKRARRTPPR